MLLGDRCAAWLGRAEHEPGRPTGERAPQSPRRRRREPARRECGDRAPHALNRRAAQAVRSRLGEQHGRRTFRGGDRPPAAVRASDRGRLAARHARCAGAVPRGHARLRRHLGVHRPHRGARAARAGGRRGDRGRRRRRLRGADPRGLLPPCRPAQVRRRRDALVLPGRAPRERAASAAVGMQNALAAMRRRSTSAGPVRLQMSIGAHSGLFHFFLVGGVHRELVIAGAAASACVATEAIARAGEIALSAPSARRLRSARARRAPRRGRAAVGQPRDARDGAAVLRSLGGRSLRAPAGRVHA